MNIQVFQGSAEIGIAAAERASVPEIHEQQMHTATIPPSQRTTLPISSAME